MVVVPCDTAVTNPDVLLTVATPVVLLLQVPPVDPSLRAVVVRPPPEHIVSAPDIATGIALTVTVIIRGTLQPFE